MASRSPINFVALFLVFVALFTFEGDGNAGFSLVGVEVGDFTGADADFAV